MSRIANQIGLNDMYPETAPLMIAGRRFCIDTMGIPEAQLGDWPGPFAVYPDGRVEPFDPVVRAD